MSKTLIVIAIVLVNLFLVYPSSLFSDGISNLPTALQLLLTGSLIYACIMFVTSATYSHKRDTLTLSKPHPFYAMLVVSSLLSIGQLMHIEAFAIPTDNMLNGLQAFSYALIALLNYALASDIQQSNITDATPQNNNGQEQAC